MASHSTAGNLILCQHGTGGSPPEHDSTADRYDGKRPNSLNDLALTANGDILFMIRPARPHCGSAR
jgi:sugar lactone lactonase YvrE